MELLVFAGFSFIIVALEIVGGFLFIFRKRRLKKEDVDREIDKKNNLLCRFVTDGRGRKIGESVAVDEDIIIIKSDEKYLGVPLRHVEEKEKTLLVKGLVDQDRAEMMGEKWRQESFKKINNPRPKEE